MQLLPAGYAGLGLKNRAQRYGLVHKETAASNRASVYYDMRRLSKTYDSTFSNGSGSSIPESNLDQYI